MTYFYVVTTVDLSGLESGASAEVSATVNTSEPGLVARWELNDGSGATANDSVGSADGTLINGPSWTSGMLGGGLSFDGVNDVVTAPFTQHLPVWTVALWVRSPNAPQTTPSSGPLQREANFQINWNHADANFVGSAAVRVGGNWYAARFGTLAADTWYHLMATYDGDVLRVYRDGVLVASNAQPNGPADADAGPLYFAKHATRDRFFAGTVDDVRVYDRALGAAAITALAGAR